MTTLWAAVTFIFLEMPLEEEGDGSPEGGHVLEGPAVQPRG